MVRWDVLPDSESSRQWDPLLVGMSNYTVYQSFEWGEYKRSFGWSPIRMLATDGGRPLSMIQLVQRQYPGLNVLWASGGPLGPSEVWGAGLTTSIRSQLGTPLIYCRVRPSRPAVAGESQLLRSQGWRPSTQRFKSVTLWWDLTPDLTQLERGLHGNWRHNLRRARKRKLSVTSWKNPDVEEMLRLYISMQRYKRIPDQFSREQLSCLISTFGDKLTVLRCVDEESRTVAVRACVIMGGKAWDMMAATSVEGRKVYASYLLLWSLIQQCKARGVETYDLMGVDPVANPGVYDFKVGTGATPVEYLGEWEWSNCALVQTAVNVILKAREVRGTA